MKAVKKEGRYQNPDGTKMVMNMERMKNMTKDYFDKENAVPSFPIPRNEIDKEAFNSEDSYVWLGHSSVLGKIDGVTFIVDPMLSLRASPFKCLGPKRFDGSLTPVEDLPKIDVVLITHNHYDHLDKDTVLALENDVEAIYVPLDNRDLLLKWGVRDDKIKEFDWFEDLIFKEVLFSFVPTQHFSGRGLGDRDEYLWGSWIVKGKERTVYISGDSGYNEHFKTIGEKYGPFDVAFMECGAYNQSWSEVHMMPEESVQASLDLKAEVMLPIHWAGFDLSTHTWDEPVNRAVKEAKRLGVTTTTPMIGEVVSLKAPVKKRDWWSEKGD